MGGSLRFLCMECSFPVSLDEEHICVGDVGWQNTALRFILRCVTEGGVGLWN